MWVSIHVEAGNLHPPHFTQLYYEASVPDTTAPGTELLQVRAMDGDRGANAEVRYSFLKGERLAMSPEHEGRVFGNKKNHRRHEFASESDARLSKLWQIPFLEHSLGL